MKRIKIPRVNLILRIRLLTCLGMTGLGRRRVLSLYLAFAASVTMVDLSLFTFLTLGH